MEVDDAIVSLSLRPEEASEGAMPTEPARDRNDGNDENDGNDSSPTATPATSATALGVDDNDTVRCVICLDALSEPCVAMPCAHRHFDFLCLASWLLQQQPCCPLCKAAVEEVQYGPGLSKTLPVPRGEEGPVRRDEGDDRRHPTTTRPRTNHHHRRHRPRHSSPPPPAETALARRRRIYRQGLYALHVGANRHSRCYQTLTPQLFARDPDLVSRARAFLRRELQVFWPAAAVAPASTEFLIEYIVAVLQTVDLQASSGQAEALLEGFFGGGREGNDAATATATATDTDAVQTTRHFLHELRNFLRSPYLTLESWDRHVQYGRNRYYDADEDEVEGGKVDTGGVGSSRESGAGAIARTSPQPWTRPRGDFWRPRDRDRGRGDTGRDRDGMANTSRDDSRHRIRPTPSDSDRMADKRNTRAALPQPLRCRRQHAAALREACRRYDPS